jgi:hypothetical protein
LLPSISLVLVAVLWVAVCTAFVVVVRGRRRWSLSDGEEEPSVLTCPGWLSPGLSGLVVQTRVLRLVLETPLGRFESVAPGETPWRRRERCDEYDLALVNLRHAVWDWLRLVDGLDSQDLEVLRGLGLSTTCVRRVMWAPGILERTDDVWEQVLYPRAPDLELVADELRMAALYLERFEGTLRSCRALPYR